jgi:hypothetical protein
MIMNTKSTMCIVFRDKTVDAVFVDRSMLGAQVKFMERLPRNEHVFETIASLMDSAEKTPARVRLCMERDRVIQRTLRYPAAAQEELDNLVRFEAVRHVPLPESDCLLGWSAAETPDEKQVVLNLVAARRSAVRELIDQFEEQGVPIDEAVPFCAAVTPVLADVSTLLVLGESTHLELCLYGEGILQDSQMIFRNRPGFGAERVVTAARQMAAKHKSWLGDEGVGRIFAGGTEPPAGPFAEQLGTAFGLHVHPLEVPDGISMDEHEDGEVLVEALMMTSATLAPTLNLIEDKKRKVPVSRRTLLISGLCILLGLELAAAYGFKTGSPWLQRRKVSREIKEMKQVTSAVQEMQAKSRVFRKQLYQLEKVCGSRASTMEMLKQVSEALPEDTYLRGFSSNSEGLTMRGFSKEPDRVPGLVMELPFVDALSTSDIGKKEDDYYEFKLSVSLRN